MNLLSKNDLGTLLDTPLLRLGGIEVLDGADARQQQHGDLRARDARGDILLGRRKPLEDHGLRQLRVQLLGPFLRVVADIDDLSVGRRPDLPRSAGRDDVGALDHHDPVVHGGP